MNNFQSKLKETAAAVESALEQYLVQKTGQRALLSEAMRYSTLGGGKRIRGVFVLETCSLCSGTEKEALPFAAAIEMIHAYSLIHDDLPAMDNDEYRRGKYTCHKKYGEAMGILAGDALQCQAFQTILEHSPAEPKSWEAMKVLAKAAGADGMVSGQAADLAAEGHRVEKDMLDFIYENKTGALIKAAVSVGAILGGASEMQRKSLENYAQAVGLAFQIEDDILDVESSYAQLGKPIGSDERNQKATYVSLYGLAQAKEKIKELTSCAKESISSFGERGWFLSEMANYLAGRKN